MGVVVIRKGSVTSDLGISIYNLSLIPKFVVFDVHFSLFHFMERIQFKKLN